MQFAHLGAAGSQMPTLVSRDSDSATNSASTTMTFSAMSLGPTDSRRWIVVVVGATDLIANSNTMTDISLAGASASREAYIVNDAAYGNAVDTMLGVAFFNNTASTTGDVVVTFNTTLSTSGSTYVHVFSVSDVPSAWDTSAGSADTIPNASGSIQPAGATTSSWRIHLMACIWEGQGGNITGTGVTVADIEHVNADVGDTTNGFRMWIAEQYRPIAATTYTWGNDGWVSGDAGCGRFIGFYRV